MAQNLPQAPQPQQRRGLAAYLLGMGPMPAPSQKEIAVATVIHGLDHPESIELKHDNIIPQVAGEAACKDGMFTRWQYLS